MGSESIASVLAMDTEPCPPPEDAVFAQTIPPAARVPEFYVEPSFLPWAFDEGGLEP